MYWLTFGKGSFRLNFYPLGRGQGSQGVFFFREHYEPLLEFGHIFLRPGDVALDIGANQGVFANAFASVVGPKGRVVAVEPLPNQVERLRENVASNDFENVHIEEAAISDVVGTTDIHIGKRETSASILEDNAPYDRKIKVRTTTLDQIALDFGLNEVSFIKLDAEGAELLALNGGRKLIARDRPVICVEAFDPDFLKSITSELDTLGYRPYVFDEFGKLQLLQNLVTPEANVFLLPPRTNSAGQIAVGQ